MTKENFERRKAFAKKLTEFLTAEEIAMIFYPIECEVCVERPNGTACSFNCAEGIYAKAVKEFSEHYDFRTHTELAQNETVRSEIEELAKFHSVKMPVVYGDGEQRMEEYVSLEELGRILSEIFDGDDVKCVK